MKALDELEAEGVDTTGSSYSPIDVTLLEGGN
jgi:NitT/TauT family transport system substrate-binding protein